MSEVTKNGDLIYWVINIGNDGPDTNTNVIVTDTIPPGLAYVTYQTNKGSFNMNTGIWTVGTMNVGQTAKLTLTYKVTDISLAVEDPPASGDFFFINEAVISGDNIDPNAANNTVTNNVGITTCPPTAGAIADPDACVCGNVLTNDTQCSHGTTEARLNPGSLVNLDPAFDINPDGSYNAMGMYIDPTQPAQFTYNIWCVTSGGDIDASGPATVDLPPLLAEGGCIGCPPVYGTVIDSNINFDASTLRQFTKIDDSGSVNIQIGLPNPATLGLAPNTTKVWTLKRINAVDGGSITIVPDGVDIDTQASYLFPNQDYASIDVWTDGTNYWVK